MHYRVPSRLAMRRVYGFVAREVARSGQNGRVVLHADELALIGSRRVIMPALDHFARHGVLEVTRLPKNFEIRLVRKP